MGKPIKLNTNILHLCTQCRERHIGAKLKGLEMILEIEAPTQRQKATHSVLPFLDA